MGKKVNEEIYGVFKNNEKGRKANHTHSMQSSAAAVKVRSLQGGVNQCLFKYIDVWITFL